MNKDNFFATLKLNLVSRCLAERSDIIILFSKGRTLFQSNANMSRLSLSVADSASVPFYVVWYIMSYPVPYNLWIKAIVRKRAK